MHSMQNFLHLYEISVIHCIIENTACLMQQTTGKKPNTLHLQQSAVALLICRKPKQTAFVHCNNCLALMTQTQLIPYIIHYSISMPSFAIQWSVFGVGFNIQSKPPWNTHNPKKKNWKWPPKENNSCIIFNLTVQLVQRLALFKLFNHSFW